MKIFKGKIFKIYFSKNPNNSSLSFYDVLLGGGMFLVLGSIFTVILSLITWKVWKYIERKTKSKFYIFLVLGLVIFIFFFAPLILFLAFVVF